MIRRALALAPIVLVLLAVPAGAVGTCPGFGPVQEVGHVAADLHEISGVAASTSHPGVWWVHDDSGGAPALTAIGDAGQDLGTFSIPGAEAFDWEDIAASDDRLYIADIGDNGRQRKDPRIFVVAEPATAPDGHDGTLRLVRTIHLTYPDGPVDAEALVMDGRSETLYVLTKEIGSSRVFRVPDRGDHVTLEQVARFDLPLPRSRALGLPGLLVTGADMSSDGSALLVRTYRSVLLFRRGEGRSFASAFADPPCEAPQAEEAQGEAVAWDRDDRGYVTLSEGDHVAVHRVDGLPPPATTTTAAPEGTAGSSDAPLVALLAGVAGLGLVVLVLSRRRAGRPRTPGSRRP